MNTSPTLWHQVVAIVTLAREGLLTYNDMYGALCEALMTCFRETGREVTTDDLEAAQGICHAFRYQLSH